MATEFDVTISKPRSATGGIAFAPLGTDLPMDASKALPVAFKPFGYIGEDGVTLSSDSSDEDVRVWGGYKVRKIRSEYSETLSFRVLSTRNIDTLKACFGENQVVDIAEDGSRIQILHTAEIPSKKVYSVETRDEEGFFRRYLVPDGQLMVSGDRTLTHSSPDGFEASIECFPDQDGVCLYELISMPSK